jgi:hypothetical protein
MGIHGHQKLTSLDCFARILDLEHMSVGAVGLLVACLLVDLGHDQPEDCVALLVSYEHARGELGNTNLRELYRIQTPWLLARCA